MLSSVIRDAAGNRLGSPPTPEQEQGEGLPHVITVYRSAAGPPSVIGADLPGFTTEFPNGDVPTNRRSLRLEFDRGMQSVSAGDVRLVLGDNLASVDLDNAQRQGPVGHLTDACFGAEPPRALPRSGRQRSPCARRATTPSSSRTCATKRAT